MMAKQASRFRWKIIALIFCICILNYIDRGSMSYTISLIAEDIHLNPSEMGLILAVFSFGYIFTALIGGVLIDSRGSKRILSWSILLWSGVTCLTGYCHTLEQFLLMRFLLGIAEGPMFPALARVITDWLPNQQKSFAFSLSLISVPLSMAISGPVLTQILKFHSWQNMYFILGVISFCILPIWLIFFKNNPKDSPYVSAEERQLIQSPSAKMKISTANQQIPWKKIIFHPTLLVNNLAYFIFGFYLFFFMNWLPAFLKKEFAFSLQAIGWMTVVPWMTAVIMMLGLGYLADRLHQSTQDLRKSRTYLIILSQLFAGMALVLMLILSPKHILFFLSLAIGFVMSANSLYYVVVSDIIKPKAATALGIMVWYFALAGFIAPYFAGILIDLYGNFNVIFIFMILLIFLSTLLLYAFHNRPSQIIYD